MKKNLHQKKSSPLKKIVLAIAGLLLIATGVQAAGKSLDIGWMQILNGPIEQLEDLKEDEVGCCLPQCGESSQAVCKGFAGREWIKGSCENLDECKMGCCQYDCKVEQLEHDVCDAVNGEWNVGPCDVGCCRVDMGRIETLTYKTCSECTGGSWIKGQMYTSYMAIKDSDVFGDNKANWEMRMGLQACGDDPVTANWTGAWDWVWVVEFPNGAHHSDQAGDIASFTPDSGGKAYFSIGDVRATVTVSKSNIHIVYPMPNLGDIILDGPIIKE